MGGLSILLSTSKQLIKEVRKRVANGYCVYCKNMDEAVEIANQLAPEHLQIVTNNALSIAAKQDQACRCYFYWALYSPTALGDYAAGPQPRAPNHGDRTVFLQGCPCRVLPRPAT